MSTVLRLLVCLALLSALPALTVGCGQKGKLYRPGEPEQAPEASP